MPSQQEIILALGLLNPESKKRINKILEQFPGLAHGKGKVDLDHLLDDNYPQEELEGKFKEFSLDLEKAGLKKDILEKILWLKQKKEVIQEAKAEYIKKMVKGQKIRIFCDVDWDGAVSGAIFRLFSGAEVQEVIAAGANFDIDGKFTGGGKKQGILDVAIDTREKNAREDIRIDHHMSSSFKEDKERLTFIIDPKAPSAVSIVARILRAPIDDEIIRELNKIDSPQLGISKWATHFIKGFMKEHNTLGPAAAAKTLTREDFSNADKFHKAMMPFLQEGFNIATLGGRYEEHEKMLAHNFNIRFIKTAKVIIAYSDDNFKLPPKEYGNTSYYFKTVYYANEADLPAYHLYAFYPSKRAEGSPFELFAGRNDVGDVINIGNILDEAKNKFDNFNGGGRPDVGGANFSGVGDKPSEQARLVYQFVLKKIAEHYGVLDEIKGIKWLREKKKEEVIETELQIGPFSFPAKIKLSDPPIVEEIDQAPVGGYFDIEEISNEIDNLDKIFPMEIEPADPEGFSGAIMIKKEDLNKVLQEKKVKISRNKEGELILQKT